jgi:hypothetical protein
MRTSRRLVALAAAALAASPAAAELAPNYQRQAELRAVVSHAAITRAFGSDPIERVEFVRADLYRVSSGRCRIDAAIVGLPVPKGVAGPRRFDVRPGPLVCAR